MGAGGYKLPKELTTATPLSKALAFICFITIPIIAFFFGIRVQEKNPKVEYEPPVVNVGTLKKRSMTVTPSPSPKKLPTVVNPKQ